MELSKLAESIGGKLAGNKQVDYSAVVSELSKSFAHQKKAERTAKPEKEAVKPVKSVEKPPKPVK